MPRRLIKIARKERARGVAVKVSYLKTTIDGVTKPSKEGFVFVEYKDYI